MSGWQCEKMSQYNIIDQQIYTFYVSLVFAQETFQREIEEVAQKESTFSFRLTTSCLFKGSLPNLMLNLKSLANLTP